MDIQTTVKTLLSRGVSRRQISEQPRIHRKVISSLFQRRTTKHMAKFCQILMSPYLNHILQPKSIQSMMAKHKQFLPFRLSDGSIVQIQYTPAKTSEEEVGIFNKTFSFEEVSKQIGVLASDLGNALKSVQPSKLAIEFGVDLDVDATTGLLSMFVSGSASGTIKITFEWEKVDPK